MGTPRARELPVGGRPVDTVVVLAVGVLLGTAVSTLSFSQSVSASFAMAVAVLISSAILVRRLGTNVGIVVLLIITSLIDRGTFKVGSVDIRAEQVAALVAFAILCITRCSVRRTTWLRPSLAEAALAAWFTVGLISSLVWADSRSESLKVLALLVLSSLGILLPPRILEGRRHEVEEAVRWLLLAVATESAYAVAAYSLHWFGPVVSSSLSPGTGLLSAYGTLWEPNVLGAVSAAGAAGWVCIGRAHFRYALVGILLCASATIVSFARAAWLAEAVVIFLYLAVKVGRQGYLRLFPRVFQTLAVIGIILIVISAFVVKLSNSNAGLSGVVRSLGNPTDIVGRFVQFGTVLTDIRRSPIFGGGIDSFGQRHVVGGVPEHIANLELGIVNDTGLLGLLIFGAFALIIMLQAWRHRRDTTVVGLAGMTLVIAITNQATETLELMITWLLVGLLLAASETATHIRAPAAARTAPHIDS